MRQALVLIREKLGLSIEDCPSFDILLERYAEALWLEEREIDRMAAAIAKAFGDGKRGARG